MERDGEGTLLLTTQGIPATLAAWSKNRVARDFVGQSPEEIDGFRGNARRAPARSPDSVVLPAAQPTRLSRSAVADRPWGWHTGPVACAGPAVYPRSNAMSLSPAFDDAAGARPPQAARLGPKLRALAERGVYFGTSSWKYEGWLGSIYSPERYTHPGQVLEEEVRGGLPGRVRPDLPHRLRGLCVLPVPQGRVSGRPSSTARRRR